MSEQIARQFHDVYERLAPQFGYETREDTKVFDPQSQNGRLMIAVCAEVIGEIERERDEAREDAKRATHDAAQETIKVSTTKSHWIEACRERDEAREALRKLSQLVHRLFALLETVEVSDSEREFHPTVIRSCRVAHTSELAELLPALKEAAK